MIARQSDTAHALVDPEVSSRELFYVAMTRGKQRNYAYVIVPDPHEIEAHLGQPGLLRAKGFVQTESGIRLVQVVGRRIEMHPCEEPPSPDLLGRVVLIRRAQGA